MSYVRDPGTSIIINTDDSYYRSILAMRQQQKEAEEACRKLNALEAELNDIRSLLQQVVNGKK
jgi:hypothetical protein